MKRRKSSVKGDREGWLAWEGTGAQQSTDRDQVKLGHVKIKIEKLSNG